MPYSYLETPRQSTITDKINQYLPIYGKFSEDAGSDSDTMSKKTANESKTVISSDTFSPDSVGSKNPNAAIDPVSIHGNNIVKT